MVIVHIKKDGFYREESFGDEGGSEQRKLVADHFWYNRIFAYLRKPCTIDPNVTLGDVFAIVESFPDLMDFFLDYSECDDIEAHHEEAKEGLLIPNKDDEEVTALEVLWEGELGEQYVAFHGIGKKEGEEKPEGYAIEFSPLSELVNLPILLNTSDSPTGSFTLLEVLDAIYYEISFCGSPEEKASKLKELKASVAEISIPKLN